MDYILIPGAWMGAWVWEPVTRGLRALGHRVHPVTLSGLATEGEVSGVSLATHVQDVLSILDAGDLRDAILVGHLYGGIVAGQVADRAPEHVAHIVYVEAFLPHDGQSLLDAYGDTHAQEGQRRQIAAHRGRWPAPTAADLAQEQDLSAEQQRWLVERFVSHPGRTIAEPAVLQRPVAAQRATYIACTMAGHAASADVVAMRTEPTWTFRTLEAGHWPMVSAPAALVALLADVAAAH